MSYIPDSYDVFVSHASEDKEEVARPLATALERYGLTVWFDESVLRPGVSLSSAIDAGLYRARYGVVILSANFFSKNWPKYELAGLKARQLQGEQVIIPVWHKINVEEVLRFSPPLADMLAYNTATAEIQSIAEGILQSVRAGSHNKWLIGTIRTALSNLDKTENNLLDHDYWPEGGLRTLHSHLHTFATYQQLAGKFGSQVWLRGPHNNSRLDLHNQVEFGHYNPDFVIWLSENIRFAISSNIFRAGTASLVSKYMLSLLTIYYSAYNILRCNPNSKARLIQEYSSWISAGTLKPQYYWGLSWISNLDPDDPVTRIMTELDKHGDINRASAAIYFWLRREIDGTAPLFFGLLVDFLNAYNSATFTNLNTFMEWYHE